MAVDTKRFIGCVRNNIKRYNLGYLYAVIEGKVKDEIITDAFKLWSTEKGFGCKDVADYIRARLNAKDKAKGSLSKNPALRRRLAEQ